MKCFNTCSNRLGFTHTAGTRRALALVSGSLLLGSLSSVQAGGLFMYEVSTTETSMAGAGWAARAQDPTTVFTNPAGMSRLKGTQIQFSATPMYLDANFDSDSGENTDFSSWLPFGSLYATHELNDQWTLGLGMGGNFGLALDYGSQWDGRYYVNHVKLQSMSFQPTVSYQVNDEWSVGAGVSLVYTVFEQKMQINNIDPTLEDGSLKLKDSDISTLINLGVMYEPTESTRFGLQYTSASDVNLNTKTKFKDLGDGLNTALGKRGLLDAKLDLGMTIPQTVMFSAFHQLTEDWAVMGNIGWQNWSEFGKVDVDINAVDTTVDQDYKDTWNFALGVQYQIAPDWRLNSGVAYDTAMYDDDQVVPALPTGETWRYGIGATYDYSERLQFSAGYEILWTGNLDMDVDRGPLAGELKGEYKDVAIHFFSFSVNWLL